MAANPLNVRECRYRVASVALAAAVALAAVFGARLVLAQERHRPQAAGSRETGIATSEATGRPHRPTPC